MEVVEMLCPKWPPRELARGGDFRLSGKPPRGIDSPTSPNLQASLTGFEPPVPTDRLFFGIFPDKDTAERMSTLAADVRRRHGFSAPLHALERLHLTLFHIGDWAGLPPATVEAAAAAVAKLSAAPFAIRFNQIGSFQNRRFKSPLVISSTANNEEIFEFRRRLGHELTRAGFGRSVTDSFTPHVTLAYALSVVPFEPIDPIEWQASEFVLIHSELGKTRHNVLGRWPLLP